LSALNQNGKNFDFRRFKATQSGPRNRLLQAAANKASKVKQLKAYKTRPNYSKLKVKNMLAKKNNARAAVNTNVVDARVRLLQKALVQPTVIVDARQKLTKQKDAREKIQERRSHLTSHDVNTMC